MSLLLTASILFLFTLLVPGFASQWTPADPKEVAALERKIQRLQALEQALKEEQQALSAGNSTLRERRQLGQDVLQTTNNLQLAIAQLTEANAGGEAQAKKAAAAIRELDRAQRRAASGMKAADSAARNLANELGNVMGISSNLGSSIIGSFVQARQEGASFGQMLGSIASAMKDTFSVGNIFVSVINKITEATVLMAGAQDEAISSFLRATGASQGYNQTMERVFQNTRTAGVSFGEAGQAMETLYTQMASFSTLNSSVQGDLSRTVALMGEIGVSTDSAARTFNTLVQTMARTPTEAARISREMVEMAERIGIPPARMIQEFAQASSQLAQYGDRMTQVFYRLEAAAKATGLAVNELIGYTSQFDTFYGAAEAVGRLNSLLGGPYFNAIQMINAEESERIRLTLQGLETSGRSWMSMDRYTRQAFAHAAGIRDMNTAASIFNQTTAQFDDAQRRIQMTAASEEELAARAREAQTVFEMFKNTLYSFAIMIRPLVEDFRDLVQMVARVADKFSQSEAAGKIVRFVVIIGTLTAALTAAGFALSSLLSPIGAAAAALGSLAYIMTQGHSPTFPEYIGIAAINMGNLARSAREALPSVKALNREMSMTAAAMAATATAATNANLRATAGGLSVVRVEESAELKNIFYKLLQSNEHYANRLEAAATSETVLYLKDREFGRAAKTAMNREMRMQGR